MTEPEQATHTVSLDFDSRDDAERVFDRLERLKWVASSGATLSLRSGDAARDPSDARFEQKLRDGLRTWKPNQYHASDMAFVLRLLNEARAQ